MPDGSVTLNQPMLADPQNEAYLLAGLMKRPARWFDIESTGLRSHMFTAERFNDLFEAIVARAGDQGDITHGLVREIAVNDPELRAYINQLAATPTETHPAALRAYAETVVDWYGRRLIVQLSDRLRTAAYQPVAEQPIASAIASAMLSLEEVSSGMPAGRSASSVVEAIDAALDDGQARAVGEGAQCSTGFPSLDRVLGPLERGALYILGARPAMGKTALGLQIAEAAAAAGRGVGIMSLEMRAPQLARRIIAAKAQVPLATLRAGDLSNSDADRVVRQRAALHNAPMTIVDEGGLSVAQIGMRAREIRRRHGLELLVIDHLHLIQVEREDARLGATWAIGRVSNGLKRLAKDLDVPVLALAQLNRGVEGRESKRPTLADLRQSGDIEQDAEAVMLLHRPEYYLDRSPPARRETETEDRHRSRVAEWDLLRSEVAGRAEIIVAKNRDGEPGVVTLHFDGTYTRFTDTEAA